ncbi:glycosyltransferase family 4 protein [Leeia aquatica]|uniref:Glycosyltransferase family 4 protein n=1 Tax=Leeia aquatica TaxID=2725557 RepID=A0A847SGW3_9NEIS|nr:glycosyltransferase family 4 protein [Leeia aquatica]NLR76439.1 glycosyltransferase family 4 protein [Leeia aquatica]
MQYVPHGAIPDTRGFAPAIVAQELALHLPGYKHVLVSAREGLQARASWNQWPVYRFESSRLYTRVFWKWFRFNPWPLERRLAAIARKVRPDILHVHQLEFDVASFRKWLGWNLPCVVHAHVRTQRPQAIPANAYIAVSGYVRKELVDKGFDPHLVHVIHNGVNPEVFHAADVPQKMALRLALGLPVDRPIIFFFGRKQHVKGYDICLNVIEQLSAEEYRPLMVTIGPLPPGTERELGYAERQLQCDRLIQCGALLDLPARPHAELAQYLAAADMVLLPTRHEPQGMVVLEAMAMGCAVLAGATGGVLESITDDVNGGLLSADAPLEHWVSAVRYWLQNPAHRQRLGAAAAQTVKQQFEWQHAADKLDRLYQTLLKC